MMYNIYMNAIFNKINTYFQYCPISNDIMFKKNTILPKYNNIFLYSLLSIALCICYMMFVNQHNDILIWFIVFLSILLIYNFYRNYQQNRQSSTLLNLWKSLSGLNSLILTITVLSLSVLCDSYTSIISIGLSIIAWQYMLNGNQSLFNISILSSFIIVTIIVYIFKQLIMTIISLLIIVLIIGILYKKGNFNGLMSKFNPFLLMQTK